MQNINQTLEKYMKLNIGDPVLVTGPAHFEKAEVIERSKGIYTLNNQMKITKDLSIIGNSRFKVTPFNDEEYDYLLAVKNYHYDLETARIVAKTAIDNITRVADNYCAKSKDEGNKEIEDFMNNVVYKIMKKRVVKEMLNV